MFVEEEDAEEFEPLPVKVPRSALDYLQSIYRNPIEPEHRRLRAAMAALPYESPRLAVTALLRDEHGFAAALDRAIARSGKAPKLIDGRAEQVYDE
jgi:hypothetical protein